MLGSRSQPAPSPSPDSACILDGMLRLLGVAFLWLSVGAGCKPSCATVENGIRTGAPGWQARTLEHLDCVPPILKRLNREPTLHTGPALEQSVLERRRLAWATEQYLDAHGAPLDTE